MVMNLLKNTQEGNFRLEDAKPEDAEVMRTIVRDAWLEIYPNEEYEITSKDIVSINWYTDMDRRKKEIAEDKDKLTWVLKHNKDEIIGFCKAVKTDGMGEIKGK